MSSSACVGSTVISLWPLVTDIVYAPPPLNFSFGVDKWLTYVCPAMRKAESDRRYVLLNPLGICMHSGIITLIVSCESRVRIPWNSPSFRLDSDCPEKHPVK